MNYQRYTGCHASDPTTTSARPGLQVYERHTRCQEGRLQPEAGLAKWEEMV